MDVQPGGLDAAQQLVLAHRLAVADDRHDVPVGSRPAARVDDGERATRGHVNHAAQYGVDRRAVRS
jgi:hypothetical protein